MTDKPSEATLRQRATDAALRRVRDAHKDEYRTYLAEEAEVRGVTVTLRKTQEEKAQEKLAQLLEENPSLRAQLAEAVTQGLAERQEEGEPEGDPDHSGARDTEF